MRRLTMMIALARARAAAFTVRGRLAPGALSADESAIHTDQDHLLKLRRRHGPTFKMWWKGKFTTCIVGHARAKRWLAEHKNDLEPVTADMTGLFPLGFMRALEGETHTLYRRRFLTAFQAVPVAAHREALRAAIRDRLDSLAKQGRANGADVAHAAKSATTAAMLHLVLGIEDRAPIAQEYHRAYDDYSPEGPNIFFNERERAGYARLKALVAGQVRDLARQTGTPRSLLECLVRTPDFDDTTLGNLVHMVENGRFDMHGLWRWIVLEAATQPAYLGRIRSERDPAHRAALAASFVSETLRMNQSEYLQRLVRRTFVFDGIVFPAGSYARVCIWEGHRDPEQFEDPDVFLPDRFLGRRFDTDKYAPLGLDRPCLGATWTFDLAALLVEELALGHDLRLIARGTAQRGRFHFEPGADSEIEWLKRSA